MHPLHSSLPRTFREFLAPTFYELGYGCIVLGLLDTEEEIDAFLGKVKDCKY